MADVPAIVEHARNIANVAYVQDNLFSCSQDSQAQMVEKIAEHNLNRVVVAACSPSTHQPIFQDMLRTAGLNKYLFEMANIRNQCTWVHLNEPDRATGKCQDLVNMARGQGQAAPAAGVHHRGHQPAGLGDRRRRQRHDLGPGPGEPGLRGAPGGTKVPPGGQRPETAHHLAGRPGGPRLDALIEKVTSHDNIIIHFNAMVTGVSGVVGNFTSTLSTGAAIEHGIVVIAIGAEPYRPEGEYLYNQNPNVLLSLDLDVEITENTERLKQAQAVAFIQCVGSRIPERPYCNKVCCAHSVENAIKLKVMNPEQEVYILYRDMRTYGERELLYQRARELGVVFIRFRLAEPPQVEEAGGRLKITVKDQILGRPVSFGVDLLSLATAIIPPPECPPGRTLQDPANAEGFFSEAHAKIRPVEAPTEGIYLTGLCHYPKPIQESVAESLAVPPGPVRCCPKSTSKWTPSSPRP